ncbi:MAG: 2-oxoglutarate dehydrogenase E1 component [Bacteroidetes bacterium]|nr:2-oxoglutarate dehydrogenase E1 component [Bacteroidota bacterium]MBS1629645.1 2-oxoglutarate dehydrogenase E1 component [Bacteroidota bacterium]
MAADFSFISNAHPQFIEGLYTDYLRNPEGIDPEWASFFKGFDYALDRNGGSALNSSTTGSINSGQMAKEFAVFRMIRAYRKRGHLLATTNPIRPRKDRKPFLALADFGLDDSDLNTVFAAGQYVGKAGMTLRDILDFLKKTYTGDVGIEYTYITDKAKCAWVEREFEAMQQIQLSLDQKKRILEKLNEGVVFEKFLQTKFIGQKRFSLEGGESTIPFLNTVINEASRDGVKEVVIGMAHRGRLNVLANILGKTYEQIFSEFEGDMPADMTMGSGDVKYHLGFRATHKTPDGTEVNVQLCPNPSHLEVVNPVVAGFSRAKADAIYNHEYDRVLPIFIHGDSAVAGQGVVYELLQMSELKGYDTGGAIHFIINNQIGFTTDFDDARSSDYCTSIASMVQAPVLHVNGDDPEAVVKCAMLAAKYRQQFNEDIFVDMVCYRRHGHNEGDDPAFTQPLMYDLIKKHPNPREVYNEKLIARGDVDGELAQEMEAKYWKTLQDRLDEVKQKLRPYKLQPPEKAWEQLIIARAVDFEKSPETGISKKELENLVPRLMQAPDGFTPLRKIKKLLDDKLKLYETEQKLDWSTAELLAYASLVAEGHDVRMSGQDVQRGTFSHRHAVLHDEQTNAQYNRVEFAAEATRGDTRFYIYNSLLSEFAVLGFEYGYSIANPGTLTIWEAQFGDFANGCQTVIDQYIASAETKWQKMSGLVVLLPHGYEGQGPEHSSARMERFLQLCAEENMAVTNVTTAANFFHALRRQLTWNFRVPLINFSPKANLRLHRAYSTKEEFTSGSFQELIDDSSIQAPGTVQRVILCTGKIFYELSDKQEADQRKDVAILRLEQLYPLPTTQLQAMQAKYKNAEWIWVQEEPLNAGAASFLNMHCHIPFKKMVSRGFHAASATGFGKQHAQEQAKILEEAFAS